jgi:hypothetical protein
MIKRFILGFISFCFLTFAQAAYPSEVTMMTVIGGATAAGWSDNFDGGSGNLEDRTGWATELRVSDNNPEAGTFTLGSNIVTHADNQGASVYILAEHTPADADYCVSIDVSEDTEYDYFHGGPCVRCIQDTGGLSGYYVTVRPLAENYNLDRRCDGNECTTGATLIDQDTVSYDFTSPVTVKLCVTTNGGNQDFTVYFNDNLEGSVTDSSGADEIVNANSGGIVSNYHASGGNYYFDNYDHDG